VAGEISHHHLSHDYYTYREEWKGREFWFNRFKRGNRSRRLGGLKARQSQPPPVWISACAGMTTNEGLGEGIGKEKGRVTALLAFY